MLEKRKETQISIKQRLSERNTDMDKKTPISIKETSMVEKTHLRKET
jgi:hypothetical protein